MSMLIAKHDCPGWLLLLKSVKFNDTLSKAVKVVTTKNNWRSLERKRWTGLRLNKTRKNLVGRNKATISISTFICHCDKTIWQWLATSSQLGHDCRRSLNDSSKKFTIVWHKIPVAIYYTVYAGTSTILSLIIFKLQKSFSMCVGVYAIIFCSV